MEETPNPAGIASSLHLSGSIDFGNPFFQQLGSNPRSCATCHSPQQGWTINSLTTAIHFFSSQGTAPLFNLVDEGSRPDADISTFEARKATFLPTTVNKAVTRFTRSPPAATAEFTVVAVSDPSGFSTPTAFLGFRRPTPTANESKAASILWTGVPPVDVITQLRGFLPGPTRLHEQRDPTLPPLPTEMVVAAGDFMFGVIFAQLTDFLAGRLDAAGAKGGPTHLMAQEFYVGINDPAGGDPKGRPFNPKVFNIFDAWASFGASTAGVDAEALSSSGGGSSSFIQKAARGAIYRGQEIFNGVGRCSGCHSVPNVGGSSFPRFFNIGTAEAPRCDTAVLPMLTVENKTTLERKQVCDLGRASATGLWADIGRFRAPPLRGLAARAPFFHDGQAKDLGDVVDHYNARLNLNLSTAQKRDLRAFLRAL